MTDLYDRQKYLDLKIPRSAAVLGCGGIGAWVALDLALAGVPEIWLVDPDTIENTNLNRTPFKQRHVGIPKVQALTSLILERREECQVFPIRAYDWSLPEGFLRAELVVDCRDNKREAPNVIVDGVVMALGYDGYNVTIEYPASYGDMWGEGESGYSTVPSFVVPPQLASCLALTIVLGGVEPRERVLTFDIRDILKGGGEDENTGS